MQEVHEEKDFLIVFSGVFPKTAAAFIKWWLYLLIIESNLPKRHSAAAKTLASFSFKLFFIIYPYLTKEEQPSDDLTRWEFSGLTFDSTQLLAQALISSYLSLTVIGGFCFCASTVNAELWVLEKASPPLFNISF